MTENEIPYRSTSRLAALLTILEVLLSVITALGAFATAVRIEMLDTARFGTRLPIDRAKASDNLQQLFAILELSGAFLVSLLFLVWVYRSSRNLRALGALGLRHTPTWSVAWFFIPIANLFMPYAVLKEQWQASSSTSRTDWRSAVVSPVLPALWIVGILFGMVQYGPIRIVFNPQNLTEQLQSWPREFLDFQLGWFVEDAWGHLSWQIMSIASGVLSVVVVLTITHLQEKKYHALAEERASFQP